jgi:S-formylglutathione hydrolase FrmB
MQRMIFLVAVLITMVVSVRAATVDTVKVYSNAMRKTVRSVVVHPAVTPARKAFPVLYLLHGFGGNFALWITKVPQLKQLSERYGCIIVCPDAGYTTLYFDNPLDSNSKFETHFINELMPYIESHYPTLNQRRYRAISGLSMGGFGALLIASRHMPLFSAAGSMSGVLDLQPFSKNSVLAKKITDTTCCSVNWDKFPVARGTDSVLPGGIRLAIECGLDDYLLNVNRNVHKRLTEQGIAHDYAERPGKHAWIYWQNAIEYQLLFFRKGWVPE